VREQRDKVKESEREITGRRKGETGGDRD